MDSIPLSSLFIILIILIALSAYFSGSETAVLSVNRYRLRFLVNEGHKGAIKTDKLLQKTDTFLTLVLIFNNLVNFSASAISTMIGFKLAGDLGVAIATGALTFFVLIFGEIYPKTVAALYSERFAFLSSHVLDILMTITKPLVILVSWIVVVVSKLTNIDINKKSSAISPEELRSIVNEAGKFIPATHKNMLLSILDLEQITVDDIMVPRSEISGIDINDDWKSIIRRLSHAAHGRFVIYKDDIEKNILGMLRIREAYRLMLEKNEFTKETLLRAIDEAYFIPEGTPLNAQLLNFKQNKERIGLVVDEYGDIKGLVTLEDILEEIVGEFTTSSTPNFEDEFSLLADGSVIIEGTANLRDLNRKFKWNLTSDEYRTFNGWILEQLEEIPIEGYEFSRSGLKITILDVTDNMVKQAKVERGVAK